VIFVTVGTTMPFDELLEEVDLLAGLQALGNEVVCQYGQSAYRMKHGKQFKARTSIDDLIEKSSLVITHGGSTVIKLMLAKKPFVAFPNPRGAGNHQTEFLKTISEVARISWSKNVKDLRALYDERVKLGPAVVNLDIPSVTEQILGML
jgi:beta-1,4-N-acetylglucosaminyltransferase